VSDGDLALAARVWPALRQPDPTPLADIAQGMDGYLTDLRPALRRHLQELPWAGDGLSLTERITLEAVRDGERPLGKLFWEVQRRDPLPTYGDLGYFDIVQAMLRAAEPPLCVRPDTRELEWPHWYMQLTPLGEALL